VSGLAQAQGKDLLQRELEKQESKPPVYGISSQFLQVISSSVPGSSKQEQVQSQERMELCAEQALWFPILQNFTSLILSPSQTVRTDALAALEKTLEEQHATFSDSLWREIMSQVLLPTFETIQQGTETHLLATLKSLLTCLNRFFTETARNKALISSYSDVLCLFASNITSSDLATVVMEQIKSLMVGVGNKGATAEQWGELIDQLSLLFQACQPQLLMNEMQSFQT
jgi:hypothetical protein